MVTLYYAGKLKQEVKHNKLTNFPSLSGMCTTGGVLWAAAMTKGMLKILIDAKLVPASKFITG